ncbi:hypothetical protein [Cupriavidus sp. TMH.W2]
MTAFRLPIAMPETRTRSLPEGKRAYETGKAMVNDQQTEKGDDKK